MECVLNEPLQYPVTRSFTHMLRGIKLQYLIKEIEQQENQQRKAREGDLRPQWLTHVPDDHLVFKLRIITGKHPITGDA